MSRMMREGESKAVIIIIVMSGRSQHKHIFRLLPFLTLRLRNVATRRPFSTPPLFIYTKEACVKHLLQLLLNLSQMALKV